MTSDILFWDMALLWPASSVQARRRGGAISGQGDRRTVGHWAYGGCPLYRQQYKCNDVDGRLTAEVYLTDPKYRDREDSGERT